MTNAESPRNPRRDELARLARAVATGARGAGKLWRLANKDGRLTDAARALIRQMRQAVIERDPSRRLGRQLTAIDSYLRDAPLPAFRAGTFRDRSAALRKRVHLLGAMPADGRASTGRRLEREIAGLFADVIAEPTGDAARR